MNPILPILRTTLQLLGHCKPPANSGALREVMDCIQSAISKLEAIGPTEALD